MKKIFCTKGKAETSYWDLKRACAFSGHRPSQLPFEENQQEGKWFVQRLSQEVDKQINRGKNVFICGMALGVDMLLGELILEKKKKAPLMLVAAIPYEGQERKWSAEYQKRYQEILKACDFAYVFAQNYEKGVFHRRNRFMVENADTLLAGYNGQQKGGTFYTICYGKKLGKEIIVVPPHCQLCFL